VRPSPLICEICGFKFGIWLLVNSLRTRELIHDRIVNVSRAASGYSYARVAYYCDRITDWLIKPDI